jgi:hypothetical protein
MGLARSMIAVEFGLGFRCSDASLMGRLPRGGEDLELDRLGGESCRRDSLVSSLYSTAGA